MTQAGTGMGVEDRIRSFLEDLSPRAREFLLRGIKDALDRGQDDPVLAVIAAAAKHPGERLPRDAVAAPELNSRQFSPSEQLGPPFSRR